MANNSNAQCLSNYMQYCTVFIIGCYITYSLHLIFANPVTKTGFGFPHLSLATF